MNFSQKAHFGRYSDSLPQKPRFITYLPPMPRSKLDLVGFSQGEAVGISPFNRSEILYNTFYVEESTLNTPVSFIPSMKNKC